MKNTLIITVVLVILVIVGAVVVFQKGLLGTSYASQQGGSGNSVTNPSQTSKDATNQSTTQVMVTSSGFQPQTLTISTGTKVTWVNTSGQAIAIDSNPHPIHTSYPPLNLGRVENSSSISLTFDQPGTYGYHNHLDPSQTATIIVK